MKYNFYLLLIGITHFKKINKRRACTNLQLVIEGHALYKHRYPVNILIHPHLVSFSSIETHGESLRAINTLQWLPLPLKFTLCKSFFLSLLSDTTLISTFQTALPISLGDFSFLLFFPYFSLSVLCFIFPQTDIFICGMNDTRVVIIVFPTFVVRFCVIRWLLGYYLFCL